MPVRPQRVVALDFMFAESVIALDLVPVGMADTAFYPGWLGYQSERLANVTDIGSRWSRASKQLRRSSPT